MRNPTKLKEFYNKLAEIHVTYAPDQRPGQFFSNWLGWVINVKGGDIFFPECDEMLELLEEYVESSYPYNHGQDLFKEKSNVSD